MKKVIIYPGRFQPMLSHHATVFERLVGENPDHEVYIATSDKVEPGKSPFNYKEKQLIATGHGIDPNKVLFARSPYNNVELAKYFDEENTEIFFAVGEKDMETDPRFTFNNLNKDGINIKQNGEPYYYQMINTYKDNPMPMKDRGYIMVVPTISGEEEVASASSFRNAIKNAPNKESAREIFSRQFKEYKDNIFELVYDKIKGDKMSEDLNILRQLAGLGVSEDAPIEFKTQLKPEEIKFAPVSKSSAVMSIANRFPQGADVNDPEVKKDEFVKALMKSPSSLLSEINERIMPDENGLEVSKKLSEIIDKLPEDGIASLNDGDKKFVLEIVKVALKNMELSAGDDRDFDPESGALESIDLSDIKEEYGVEESDLEENDFNVPREEFNKYANYRNEIEKLYGDEGTDYFYKIWQKVKQIRGSKAKADEAFRLTHLYFGQRTKLGSEPISLMVDNDQSMNEDEPTISQMSDEELADYLNCSVEEVKADRKAAEDAANDKSKDHMNEGANDIFNEDTYNDVINQLAAGGIDIAKDFVIGTIKKDPIGFANELRKTSPETFYSIAGVLGLAAVGGGLIVSKVGQGLKRLFGGKKSNESINEGGSAADLAMTDCEDWIESCSDADECIQGLQDLKSKDPSDADESYANNIIDTYIDMVQNFGLEDVQDKLEADRNNEPDLPESEITEFRSDRVGQVSAEELVMAALSMTYDEFAREYPDYKTRYGYIRDQYKTIGAQDSIYDYDIIDDDIDFGKIRSISENLQQELFENRIEALKAFFTAAGNVWNKLPWVAKQGAGLGVLGTGIAFTANVIQNNYKELLALILGGTAISELIRRAGAKEDIADAVASTYDEKMADKGYALSSEEKVEMGNELKQLAYKGTDESFDPRAEQSREEEAYNELVDAYDKGGEEGLCKAIGCSMEELDQEMSEFARDRNLHMDDDRDEIIHGYIEDLVDNADWKDHGEQDYDPADMEMEEELNRLRKLSGLGEGGCGSHKKKKNEGKCPKCGEKKHILRACSSCGCS